MAKNPHATLMSDKNTGERAKSWKHFNKVMADIEKHIAHDDRAKAHWEAARLKCIEFYFGKQAAMSFKLSDGNIRTWETRNKLGDEI